MPCVSPTLEGFRASFRRPSLTLAEITWRWTVGAVGWAIIFFWLIEFLDTLPVTRGDEALLSTRQPLLVGRAISHILRGSLDRAVLAALLAAIALSLLWIITASICRAATVHALLEYFRRDTASDISIKTDTSSGARPFRSLTGLNFLRVAVCWPRSSPSQARQFSRALPHLIHTPGPAWRSSVFLPLAGLICIAWLVLNWWLSLGCMFVVRDGEDTLGALFAAVTFSRTDRTSVCREHMDWGGAPCGVQRRDYGCIGAARLYPDRSLATGDLRRVSGDAGLFCGCGLAVHGASVRVCLHRRNA